jgi:hypothetical protein
MLQNTQFKKWNDAEETQLMEEFEKGIDLVTIARNHNRSVRAIQIRLSDIAVKLQKAGVSSSAIFHSTGQSDSDIEKRKAEIALEKDPHRYHDTKQNEVTSKYDTILNELASIKALLSK